jgi:hypothetical protein
MSKHEQERCGNGYEKKVSAMVYFATMGVEEVVGNAIDLVEIKAVEKEAILKNKLMQERVTERVEKRQVEEEEMNVFAGNMNR